MPVESHLLLPSRSFSNPQHVEAHLSDINMANATFAWWAMPPTAFLSLSTLLTYLGFRVCYLSQAHHAEDANLRSLALPWIFLALELLLLRVFTVSLSMAEN